MSQLEGLRKLRLYHYKCMVNVTDHRNRLEARPVPDNERQAWARENTLKNLRKAHTNHLGFVQFLNDFFEIGDTAEQDAAK